jgi:hypothetical protein
MALPQTPALTTDCVIFDPVGRVLLIRRKHEPSAGSHALPGGFVKIGETVEATCRREVREKAGIEVSVHSRRRLLRPQARPPWLHSQRCLRDLAAKRCFAEGRVGCDERRMGGHAPNYPWLRTRAYPGRRQGQSREEAGRRLGLGLSRGNPSEMAFTKRGLREQSTGVGC